MDMTKAIISGSATALSLAKTLVTMPYLYKSGDKIHTIPLEVETYSQSGTAEVSENLIITTASDSNDGYKKYFADNVAPSSWTWQMQGYIAGLSLVEMTNIFPFIVYRNTKTLMQYFKNGTRLKFKGIDCKIYDVVIQSLDLNWEADCANKQPVSLTLKEINVMDCAKMTLATTEAVSNVASGTADGATSALGTTATSTIKDSTLLGILGKTLKSFF